LLSFDYISSEYKEEIERFEFKNTPDERSVEMFLKEKALHLHEMQTAITRLYFDEDQNLVGFFTLHNDIVSLQRHQMAEFKQKYDWRFPEDIDIFYYPSVKLHYLGVDRRHRECGYGKYMIREAIAITADEIGQLSGCNFVSVEALLSTVDYYRKRGFKWIGQNVDYANMIFKLGELEESDSLEEFEPDAARRLGMVQSLILFRESLSISQAMLAERVGLDKSDIESFEFSSTAPSIKMIDIIAKTLGMNFYD
jgi:DNA-binding XRE family transcriptional regulator/ribosomal protein S18 acetylase RimI-like enzyme